MIRAATGADREAIAQLCRMAHARSEESSTAIDAEKGTLALARFIALRSSCLVLVDDEEERGITGVLVGATDELWYSRERYAIALLVFALRPGAGRQMVRRFVKWALEVPGVCQVVLDTSFGHVAGRRAEKVYERMGLPRAGGSFIVRRSP